MLPKIDLLDEACITRIVDPFKIDTNLHCNNMFFPNYTEMSRWSLLVRCGLLNYVRQNKYGAVVAGMTFRFRRQLTVLQKFEVRCKIVGWDDKGWSYMLHTIVSNNQVVCQGLLRFCLMGKKGRVPFEDMLLAFGYSKEKIDELRPKYTKNKLIQTFCAHDDMLDEKNTPVRLHQKSKL